MGIHQLDESQLARALLTALKKKQWEAASRYINAKAFNANKGIKLTIPGNKKKIEVEKTPIAQVLRYRQPELLKELLKKGVNPNQIIYSEWVTKKPADSILKLPIEVAYDNGDFQSFLILAEHVDLNSLNKVVSETKSSVIAALVTTIKKIKIESSLLALDFTNIAIGDFGVEVINAALKQNNCEIQQLLLSNCQLSKCHQELVGIISSQKKLTTVYLSYNKQLSQGDMASIVDALVLKLAIKNINLSGINLSGASVNSLVQISEKSVNEVCLELESCNINADDAYELSLLLNDQKIKKLNLLDNPLGKMGYAVLLSAYRQQLSVSNAQELLLDTSFETSLTRQVLSNKRGVIEHTLDAYLLEGGFVWPDSNSFQNTFLLVLQAQALQQMQANILKNFSHQIHVGTDNTIESDLVRQMDDGSYEIVIDGIKHDCDTQIFKFFDTVTQKIIAEAIFSKGNLWVKSDNKNLKIKIQNDKPMSHVMIDNPHGYVSLDIDCKYTEHLTVNSEHVFIPSESSIYVNQIHINAKQLLSLGVLDTVSAKINTEMYVNRGVLLAQHELMLSAKEISNDGDITNYGNTYIEADSLVNNKQAVLRTWQNSYLVCRQAYLEEGTSFTYGRSVIEAEEVYLTGYIDVSAGLVKANKKLVLDEGGCIFAVQHLDINAQAIDCHGGQFFLQEDIQRETSIKNRNHSNQSLLAGKLDHALQMRADTVSFTGDTELQASGDIWILTKDYQQLNSHINATVSLVCIDAGQMVIDEHSSISSRSCIDLIAKQNMNLNSATLKAQKKLKIAADQFYSRAEIYSEQDLNIKTHHCFFAGESVCIAEGLVELRNQTGTLDGAIKGNMIISHTRSTLTVAENAHLESAEKTILKAKNIEIEGQIVSAGEVEVIASNKKIITTQAKVYADKKLTLHAQRMLSNGVLIAQDDINFTVEQQLVFGKSSITLSYGKVEIHADRLQHAGEIESEFYFAKTSGKQYYRRNSSVEAKRSLQMQAKFVQQDSLLQAPLMELKTEKFISNEKMVAHRYLIVESDDEFVVTESGNIYIGDMLDLTTKKFTVAGNLQSSGKLIVTSENNYLAGTAILASENQLGLITKKTLKINKGAQLFSNQKIVFHAQDIHSEGEVEAYDILMTAKEVIKLRHGAKCIAKEQLQLHTKYLTQYGVLEADNCVLHAEKRCKFSEQTEIDAKTTVITEELVAKGNIRFKRDLILLSNDKFKSKNQHDVDLHLVSKKLKITGAGEIVNQKNKAETQSQTITIYATECEVDLVLKADHIHVFEARLYITAKGKLVTALPDKSELDTYYKLKNKASKVNNLTAEEQQQLLYKTIHLSKLLSLQLEGEIIGGITINADIHGDGSLVAGARLFSLGEIYYLGEALFNTGHIDANTATLSLNRPLINGISGVTALRECYTRSSNITDIYLPRISAKTLDITAPVLLNIVGELSGARSLRAAALLYVNIGDVATNSGSVSAIVSLNLGLNLPNFSELAGMVSKISKCDFNGLFSDLFAGKAQTALIESIKFLFPPQRALITVASTLFALAMNITTICKNASKLWFAKAIQTRDVIPLLVGLKDLVVNVMQLHSMAVQAQKSLQETLKTPLKDIMLTPRKFSNLKDGALLLLPIPSYSEDSLLSMRGPGLTMMGNASYKSLFAVDEGHANASHSTTSKAYWQYAGGQYFGNHVAFEGQSMTLASDIKDKDLQISMSGTLQQLVSSVVSTDRAMIEVGKLDQNGKIELLNNIVKVKITEHHVNREAEFSIKAKPNDSVEEAKTQSTSPDVSTTSSAPETSQQSTDAAQDKPQSEAGPAYQTEKTTVEGRFEVIGVDGLKIDGLDGVFDSHIKFEDSHNNQIDTVTHSGEVVEKNSSIHARTYKTTKTSDVARERSHLEAGTAKLDGAMKHKDTVVKTKNDLEFVDGSRLESQNSHHESTDGNIKYGSEGYFTDGSTFKAKQYIALTQVSSMQGLGSVCLESEMLNPQGSVTTAAAQLKVKHLDASVMDVIKGRGKYAKFKPTKALGVETIGKVILDEKIEDQRDLSVAGNSVLVKKSIATTGDLALEATQGDVILKANIKGLNTSLLAAVDVKIKGVDAQGLNHVSVIAARNVILENKRTPVQGRHDVEMKFTPARILGGTGQGFEGIGAYVKAEHKVKIKASIVHSFGDNIVNGVKGIQITHDSHSFVAKKHTKRSCLGLRKTKKVTTDTAIARSAFSTPNGKNILLSGQGGVGATAVDFVAKQGNFKQVKGSIRLREAIGQREKKIHKQALFGLVSRKKHTKDQFAEGVLYVDNNKSQLITLDGSIHGTGVSVYSPGKFSAIAPEGKVKFDVSILEHSVKEKSISFGIGGTGIDLVRALTAANSGEQLMQLDPITRDAYQLAYGDNDVIGNVFKGENAAMSAFNAYQEFNQMGWQNMALSHTGLGDANGFNPRASVGISKNQSHLRHQTASVSRFQVGDLELIGGKGVELRGVDLTVYRNMYVKGAEFIFGGVELHAKFHQSTRTATLGINLAGTVDVGYNQSQGSMHSTYYQYAQGHIGGALQLEVDKMLIDAGVLSANSIAGRPTSIFIITRQDITQQKFQSYGASSSGNVIASQSKSETKIAKQVAALHVKQPVNTTEDNSFELTHLHLVGGVADVPNLTPSVVHATTLRDSSHSQSIGISANLNNLLSQQANSSENVDAPPAEHQPISTLFSANFSEQKKVVDHFATLSNGREDNAASTHVVGDLNYDLANTSRTVVDIQRDWDIRVPDIRPFLVSNPQPPVLLPKPESTIADQQSDLKISNTTDAKSVESKTAGGRVAEQQQDTQQIKDADLVEDEANVPAEKSYVTQFELPEFTTSRVELAYRLSNTVPQEQTVETEQSVTTNTLSDFYLSEFVLNVGGTVATEGVLTRLPNMPGTNFINWTIQMPLFAINTGLCVYNEQQAGNRNAGRDGIIRSGVDFAVDAAICVPLGWWALLPQSYLAAGRYIASRPPELEPVRQMGQEAMFSKTPPEGLSWWEKWSWYQQRSEAIETEKNLQANENMAKLVDKVKTLLADIPINLLNGNPQLERPKSALLPEFNSNLWQNRAAFFHLAVPKTNPNILIDRWGNGCKRTMLHEDSAGFKKLEFAAYQDTKGYWTVGYGHKLSRETSSKKLARLGLNYDLVLAQQQKLTQQQGKELFAMDYQEKQQQASDLLGKTHFDALPNVVQNILVDLVFNMGATKLQKQFPKSLEAFKRHDFETAAHELRYVSGIPGTQESKWVTDVKTRAVTITQDLKLLGKNQGLSHSPQSFTK